MRLGPLVAAGLLAMTAACARPAVMSAGDLQPSAARPDARVPYGPEPSQFAELWTPPGAGPHPVVIMLHGGCWQAAYGLDLMNAAADDLRRRGYAVWNVEYRRLGEPGAGYPGTFQDVAAAVEALRAQAGPRRLDLDRLVAVGHSAGGHLALWAAARPALPAGSPLTTADPLPIPAVLSLGGVGDLEAAAADSAFSGACGRETIARLVGAAERADPFADTSPVRLAMPGVRQVMLHGALEQIAPPALGRAYMAVKGGQDVDVIVPPNAGHFEVITPGAPAWNAVVAQIARLVPPAD